MMMQTIGKAVKASLLAIARQGLFLIPFLFLFNQLFGLSGILISQPASDLGAFVLSIFLTVPVFQEMKKASVMQNS
jgi:Na+-driven multidrug efflux pump